VIAASRAVAVCLVAILTACGGGDDATDVTAPDVTREDRDVAEATRIGLHVYDFPSGWAPDNAPSATRVPDEFNSCLGGPIAADDLSAQEAATIRLNANVVAASVVSVVRDQADLDARAGQVDTEGFSTCMRDAMRPVLEARLPAGAVAGPTDSRGDIVPVHEGKGAKQSLVVVDTRDVRYHTYLVFVYMRRARFEAVLAFFAAPDRLPTLVEEGVVRNVSSRLGSAN
jgi:hypothetical protein